MNIHTGELRTQEEVEQLEIEEQKVYVKVQRDLSVLEKAEMQIKLYSLCGCGSGLKFKFCCYSKG